jgi:ATP-dependent Zn protease
MFSILCLVGYFALNFRVSGDRQISYSMLRIMIEADKVESVLISENFLELKTKQPEKVTLTDNREVFASTFNSFLSNEVVDSELLGSLKKFGVGIQTNDPYPWLGLLSAFIPVIFGVGIWIAIIVVIKNMVFRLRVRH